MNQNDIRVIKAVIDQQEVHDMVAKAMGLPTLKDMLEGK